MLHLKPALEYIINDFNTKCADPAYLAKNGAKVFAVRDSMIGIKNNQGVIVAAVRKSKPDFEGNEYQITISENHFHCTCMAYQTSKRDALNHKVPCKHIIFTASSVAVYAAKNNLI